jgi:hypothetical protein
LALALASFLALFFSEDSCCGGSADEHFDSCEDFLLESVLGGGPYSSPVISLY